MVTRQVVDFTSLFRQNLLTLSLGLVLEEFVNQSPGMYIVVRAFHLHLDNLSLQLSSFLRILGLFHLSFYG